MVDINLDGVLDVAVGAPSHSNDENDPMKYNVSLHLLYWFFNARNFFSLQRCSVQQGSCNICLKDIGGVGDEIFSILFYLKLLYPTLLVAGSMIFLTQQSVLMSVCQSVSQVFFVCL